MPLTMLDLLFVEYRHVLQGAIFLCLAGYALLRGDAPEKLIGLIFASAIAVEALHHTYWGYRASDDVNVIHAGLDLLMFVSLALIAMNANRIYPLWILAAQLIALLSHLQRGLFPEIHPLAYWAMIRLPSYLQMLAYAAGLLACRRRLAHNIKFPPWRKTSSRS